MKKLSIFSLTWPLFLESLLLMLMGNIDIFMLSQYSDKAVAAVGVSNQIINFAIVMFGFVSAGAAVTIAQYIGAKKQDESKEVAAVAIISSLFFGLLISSVFIIGGEQFLRWMNLPLELMENAKTFLNIVGGFIFIQAVLTTIGAVLRSKGYTRDMLFVTMIMNILNIVGNGVLIFGLFGLPALGVLGASIATSGSRLIAVFIAFALLIQRIGNPFKNISLRKFPFHYVKKILQIGLPAAGENLSYNGYQLMLTVFITTMGTIALTTRIYTQNINMFVLLFTISLAQGGQIIIGQLMGAKEYNEIYKRCFRYLRTAVIVGTIGATLCFLFAEPLIRIFTSDQEIIDMSRMLFMMIILLEPGRAFNIIIINALRATGDVKFPVYVGIASMWGIGVVVAYVLGIVFELGLVGIWWALIADEWLRGIIMFFRWRSRIWQTKGVVTESSA